MKPLFIIKIGGNIVDDEMALESFLKSFAAVQSPKILVHGGGKLATRVAEAMGVQQQMIEGRRITDAETLKIVTMVYAGFINKKEVDCKINLFQSPPSREDSGDTYPIL